MLKDLINTKALTDEERRRYYGTWKSSGLSKAEFCREQGIPIETFHYWHKCYRKTEAHTGGFSQVHLKQVSTEISYEKGIELGMRLSNQTQFQMTLSIQQLITLVRGICDAASVIR